MVELQTMTLLHTTMEIGLAQEIKIMMCGVIIAVHSITRVPGGTATATIRTSMVSTITQHSGMMV